MNHSGDTLIGMLIDLFLKDKEATVQRRKANMGDCDHYGHGRKSEDKIPFAAASAASSMKVPKKKGRKVKPKGFPKRPLSAYNWFFKEERQKVLNLDFQQMGKEISSRWKATSKEQRKRFEELAAQDAIRYRKEVQIYEEEQILKARRMRELAKQDNTEQPGSAGVPQPALSSGVAALDAQAHALLQAAAVRAMEEKNHPDAPQWLSPSLGPMLTGSAGISPFQNFSVLEMARQQQQQQQLHQMLLANEMQQSIQQQVLQRRLALGSFQQGPTSNALLLEQLRRQEELALLIDAQRRNSVLMSQEGLLDEYIRLQQQQQLQLQERSSLSALTGGNMGLPFSGGLVSYANLTNASDATMPSQHLGDGVRSMQSSMGSRSAPVPAPASLQNTDLPVYNGSEADRMPLMRNLTQRKPEDKN